MSDDQAHFSTGSETETTERSVETELTPEGCKETENADVGAHWICETISPFMFNRVSDGSAPTARI